MLEHPLVIAQYCAVCVRFECLPLIGRLRVEKIIAGGHQTSIETSLIFNHGLILKKPLVNHNGGDDTADNDNGGSSSNSNNESIRINKNINDNKKF